MTSSPALSDLQNRKNAGVSATDGTLGFYENNAVQYAQLAAGFSMDSELQRFRSYLERGAQVLDVGCGGGRDLVALTQLGLDPTGLDFSPKLAAIAAKSSGCKTIVADMRSPPFQEATFDGIWAAAALLHLDREDLLPTLRQFRKILRPGGVLFASMKMGRGGERTADGRLFTYVMLDAWAELLTAAGFVDADIRTDESQVRDQHPTVWVQSFSKAG